MEKIVKHIFIERKINYFFFVFHFLSSKNNHFQYLSMSLALNLDQFTSKEIDLKSLKHDRKIS